MNQLMQGNFLRFPALSIPSLLEEMEDLLPTNNFLNGLSLAEDAKNIYVEAAVPGVDAQDIDVTFSRGMLTIKAKKKEEEKGKTFQRKATSSFFYRISPGDIDPKKEPSATFKNGVMTVAFAKLTEKQPKKITVKTS